MSNFSPGNMPKGGGFSSGNKPDGSSTEANGNTPSASGRPEQPTNQITMKDLITYGVYLAVMLAALLILKSIRRKR